MNWDLPKLLTGKLLYVYIATISFYSQIGDEMIRGVSGGEKKRTSVGVELVRKASM